MANHEYTNEILMFNGYDAGQPHPRAGRDRLGRARPVGRGRRGGAAAAASSPPLPRHPLNRRITATTRVRGRPVRPPGSDLLKTSADPTGTKVARHAQQLRRRRHPVGHDPVRRGELQPVLRQRRPGRRRDPKRLTRYGSPARHRAQVGAVRQALRPGAGAQRGQPVRLGRRARPVRPGLHAAQAHRARPLQARGRDRPRRPHDGRVVVYIR